MSQPEFAFRRYLSKSFEKALHSLVEDETGQWWRDVLVHPDLKLAIRADAIDIYHRGASIFHVTPDKEGRVVPRTHFKYLVRRQQGHATIAPDGKTFVYGPGETTWKTYKKGETLDEMIAACRRFAGDEKSELHAMIMYPSVIDVEIAFRSTADHGTDDEAGDPDDGHSPSYGASPAKTQRIKHHQDRLDAATLEDRAGDLWLVFHEAKHFNNKELRAKAPLLPPVSEQIARYRRSIAHFTSQIAESYKKVCHGLQELHDMRIKAGFAPAPLDSLVERAAKAEKLNVDCEPRLIVFGFDDDQKKGSTWMRHRQRLEEAHLTVYAVGKPDRKAAAAAFGRR